MDKDGVYHVAGRGRGPAGSRQRGFFHRSAQSQSAADCAGASGRGDYHANPIEEVTIAAKATDEYGLQRRDAALFGQRRP